MTIRDYSKMDDREIDVKILRKLEWDVYQPCKGQWTFHNPDPQGYTKGEPSFTEFGVTPEEAIERAVSDGYFVSYSRNIDKAYTLSIKKYHYWVILGFDVGLCKCAIFPTNKDCTNVWSTESHSSLSRAMCECWLKYKDGQ